MINYVLLHGSGPGPDMWFPWLKTQLEKFGHSVWMPTLPEGDHPDLEKQLPFLFQSKKINSDSILVGHSSSCPLIFSFLERTTICVQKAVLVAGYFPLPGATEKIWQATYDLPLIKTHSKEFTFVVSDNDPWNCNDQLSRPYFDVLGGEMLIIKDGGHFGSNHFKQPLYEFPSYSK